MLFGLGYHDSADLQNNSEVWMFPMFRLLDKQSLLLQKKTKTVTKKAETIKLIKQHMKTDLRPNIYTITINVNGMNP